MEPDQSRQFSGCTPWLRIWVSPRKAIREIVETSVNYRIYWLSAIYGFPLLLNLAQSFSLGFVMPVALIVLLSVVFCTFIGLLGFTVSSALLFWTGKWIQGKGSYEEIRAAVAWSNVPSVVQTLIWIVLIIAFGPNVFSQNFPTMSFSPNELVLVVGLFLLQAVVGIWSLFILLFALAEVQGFSAWRGLLNIVLPLAIIGSVLWILSAALG